MDHHGYARSWRAFLATLFMAATAYLGVAVVVGEVIDNSRAACARGNAVRSELHGFLGDAADNRRKEARENSGEVRRISREAAQEYQDRADKLVRTARGVHAVPGTPLIDCEKAYPKVMWYPGW